MCLIDVCNNIISVYPENRSTHPGGAYTWDKGILQRAETSNVKRKGPKLKTNSQYTNHAS